VTETGTQVTRRFASLLLLIGAALLIIGNTTHPIDTSPTATSRLALATAGSWMAIHLTITLGVLAVVGGLAVLPRAITHPLGSACARLGAVAAIVGGTTLAIVFGALDGYATPPSPRRTLLVRTARRSRRSRSRSTPSTPA
jgi:hypothetical protein